MMPLKGQMQQRSLTIKVKTTDENPGQTDKNLLEVGGGEISSWLASGSAGAN